MIPTTCSSWAIPLVVRKHARSPCIIEILGCLPASTSCGMVAASQAKHPIPSYLGGLQDAVLFGSIGVSRKPAVAVLFFARVSAPGAGGQAAARAQRRAVHGGPGRFREEHPCPRIRGNGLRLRPRVLGRLRQSLLFAGSRCARHRRGPRRGRRRAFSRRVRGCASA